MIELIFYILIVLIAFAAYFKLRNKKNKPTTPDSSAESEINISKRKLLGSPRREL